MAADLMASVPPPSGADGFVAPAPGGERSYGEHIVDGVGIHHLFGNVAEWVRVDRARTGDLDEPVVRGGSFLATSGLAVSERRLENRDARLEDVGFRCATDL